MQAVADWEAMGGEGVGSSSPSSAAVSSVGIYTVTGDGHCMQINSAALEMLGYASDEVLGQNMHALIHNRHPNGSPYPAEECPLVRVMHSGNFTCETEVVLWNRNGSPVRALAAAMPLLIAGRNAGAIITLQDMQRKKVPASHLKRMMDEQAERAIQSNISVRTKRGTVVASAQEQLLRSARLADMGRLTASISHEINNPLEAVANLLYLARTDPDIPPQSNEYLRMAEEELGRVSRIVSQTLRFQRSESSLTEMEPQTLVESVLLLHRGQLHNMPIGVAQQNRISGALVAPEGDVRQILNNLIGNAIDAMGGQGGTLTVRTSAGRNPKTGTSGLRITVSDTGNGMSRAITSHIFEPFYTTKGSAGSGLGLWISRTLARKHGGDLTVRSCTNGPRHGTTFSLFLPMESRTKETINI